MDLAKAVSSPLLQDWFQPHVLDPEVLNTFQENFSSAEPFKHLYIDNFIIEKKFKEIAEELAEQEFEYKESDLFQLAQTEDFSELGSSLLTEFKTVLSSKEFITIMEHITGINLSDDVDCLGNIYTDTDYLLCHDDKLIKRKIAYILYFTDLEEEEGGALHIFDTPENNPQVPGKIVKKIYPRYNRLTFFYVTRQSFHEVGEIIGEDVFRVSISGWFNNSN